MKDFLRKAAKDIESVIAIDFDGVIHKNSKGYHDGTIYDEPVDGCKEALEYLSTKYRLIIFTCKAKPGRPLINGKTGTELVWEYLLKYDLAKYIDSITHEKPHAKLYIDDKAIKFIDWKQTLEDVS